MKNYKLTSNEYYALFFISLVLLFVLAPDLFAQSSGLSSKLKGIENKATEIKTWLFGGIAKTIFGIAGGLAAIAYVFSRNLRAYCVTVLVACTLYMFLDDIIDWMLT